MGYGSYSHKSAVATSMLYSKMSAHETFKHKLTNDMNPSGVTVRESRDSPEHPNSFPIILGLDVTGSMGDIPHFLVKEGLPHMMNKMINGGIADPQVLFLGIGDHECDSAPLQVGQFESGDQLLNRWLTDLYIEGGGGGNNGESYLLAWYFAANHTATDHFEKRGKKGLLFTVGDEPTLTKVPGNVLNALMGQGQQPTMTAQELLQKAQEKYEIFHLHMLQGSNGASKSVREGWTELLGDHVLIVQDRGQVAQVIADKSVEVIKAQPKSVAGMEHFADL